MQHRVIGYGGSNGVTAIFVTWPEIVLARRKCRGGTSRWEMSGCPTTTRNRCLSSDTPSLHCPLSQITRVCIRDGHFVALNSLNNRNRIFHIEFALKPHRQILVSRTVCMMTLLESLVMLIFMLIRTHYCFKVFRPYFNIKCPAINMHKNCII